MKKDSLKILLKSLVPTIRKIVKTEVRKVAKPMIEEEVESRVNKVLAEHFVQNLGKTPTIVEELDLGFKRKGKEEKELQMLQEDKLRRERERQEMRERMLEAVGANSDPMLEAIYGDISDNDMNGAAQAPMQMGGQAVYVDTDDEGVDLSVLGL